MAHQRAQIFLDDDQYEEIARLAANQERPIPELIHDLVGLGLERHRRSMQDRRTALQELNAIRQSVEARHGTYSGDLVAEARAERDRQLDAVLFMADRP
jgi:hypothetical protein